MSDHTSKFRLGSNGPEYTVILRGDLQPQQVEAGLYRVTVNERDHTLTLDRASSVTTRHAAVNGIQNNLDRAAFVMLDKVATTSELQRGNLPTEFTLFHVPTRGVRQDLTLAGAEMAGQTTADAKSLADVLQTTEKSGSPVVWSVHSRGAAVFDAAADYCADHGIALKHQSLAVYNGAVNEHLMKRNLSQAGVEPMGRCFYNNPADPVPQLIGSNTQNPIRIAAALSNVPTVLSGEQSLHTWHVPLRPSDFDSVPPAQWERPGIDLRRGGSPTPFSQAIEVNGSGATAGLTTAKVRAAGISESDPTFRVLCEAIGARSAYLRSAADKQGELVQMCRKAFRRDVVGPDLTGVPFRSAALKYVQGELGAETLLASAVKHSAAAERERALGPSHSGPELQLGR